MTTKTENIHYVFVYGTLKTGEPNNHVLTDTETGQQRFVGIAKTTVKFPLVIGTEYNIPFLINEPGKGFVCLNLYILFKYVHGEVYEVDDEKLKILDKLENHPNFYCRELQKILFMGNEQIKDVWIYLMPKWSKDLYNTKTVTYESYSNTGPHGLLYTPK